MTAFATRSKLPGVVGDDKTLTIRRLWRTPQRIALDEIIAVTPYPTIVWRTREGRIRKTRLGFLYRSKSPYAVRQLSQDCEPLRNWLFERVATSNRRTRRAADNLTPADFTKVLATAEAALEWAERHPTSAGAYRELWAKHARGMRSAAARRVPPVS
jgi:hypothetical protein